MIISESLFNHLINLVNSNLERDGVRLQQDLQLELYECLESFITNQCHIQIVDEDSMFIDT